MSEEDILEIIEELQCEYKEQENENKYNNYTVFKAKKYSKAIQGLLDLYQKEKEKNRLLIEGKFREVADKNSYIKDNYISKDKIREFKNKFIKDSKNEKVFMTQSSQINASLIQFCNELLEERN